MCDLSLPSWRWPAAQCGLYDIQLKSHCNLVDEHVRHVELQCQYAHEQLQHKDLVVRKERLANSVALQVNGPGPDAERNDKGAMDRSMLQLQMSPSLPCGHCADPYRDVLPLPRPQLHYQVRVACGAPACPVCPARLPEYQLVTSQRRM